jgi:YggT family protein
MTGILIQIVNFLYYAVIILILARFILSFISGGPYELRAWVYRLTEPLLQPVRRILPPMSGLDFSPLIVLIAAQVLRMVLINILI